MTHHWSSLFIKTYFKVCFSRMCSHKAFLEFVIIASELYTTENNIFYDVFMYIRHVRAFGKTHLLDDVIIVNAIGLQLFNTIKVKQDTAPCKSQGPVVQS